MDFQNKIFRFIYKDRHASSAVLFGTKPLAKNLEQNTYNFDTRAECLFVLSYLYITCLNVTFNSAYASILLNSFSVHLQLSAVIVLATIKSILSQCRCFSESKYFYGASLLKTPWDGFSGVARSSKLCLCLHHSYVAHFSVTFFYSQDLRIMSVVTTISIKSITKKHDYKNLKI